MVILYSLCSKKLSAFAFFIFPIKLSAFPYINPWENYVRMLNLYHQVQTLHTDKLLFFLYFMIILFWCTGTGTGTIPYMENKTIFTSFMKNHSLCTGTVIVKDFFSTIGTTYRCELCTDKFNSYFGLRYGTVRVKQFGINKSWLTELCTTYAHILLRCKTIILHFRIIKNMFPVKK